MRNSIASTIWRFSTTRMLHEYVERLYLPAAAARRRGAGDAAGPSRPSRRARRAPSKGGARWPPGSRWPSPSTTTSRSATSAGCSRRCTSRPTCRWSRPSSATRASGSRCTTRARCSSGWRRSDPTFLERLRALVDRGQVEILGGGLYEPVLASLPEQRPRRPAHADGRGGRGDRRPASARARGWRSASGSRTCRRRWSARATAGRSSTTSTSGRRRSPRRTCGAPTRPRTRASC